MVFCNCLNVKVEVPGKDVGVHLPVETAIALSDEERQDSFFNLGSFERTTPVKVIYKIPWLMEIREIGSWFVHRCINCNVHTHALGKGKCNKDHFIINSKLLPDSAATALEQNEMYSKVFEILMSSDPIDSSLDDMSTTENISPDLRLAFDELKRKLENAASLETAQTEQRVRNYSEQQYLQLERFKEKANKDYSTLIRAVLLKRSSSSQSSSRKHNSLQSPCKEDAKKRILTQLRSSPNRTLMKQMSQPAPNDSLDSEGLFNFEETEDDGEMFVGDDDCSDSEGAQKIEAAYSARQQNKVPVSIAKSLPMNIPGFMSRFQQRESDDDSCEFLVHEEHPSNIAAEIKALAKSVHGDAVFGDLPRPRFSSQI